MGPVLMTGAPQTTKRGGQSRSVHPILSIECLFSSGISHLASNRVIAVQLSYDSSTHPPVRPATPCIVMPSIKGTASVTDNRALHKRMSAVKFPANFHEKVDVEKVNRAVLTQWIEQKITALLGFEDEIVQSTAVNLFLPTRVEDGPKVEINPKKAQIDLEGFLGEDGARDFATECWTMLLDAQSSGVGVPKKLVEEKKRELEAQKAQAGTRQRGPPPPRGVRGPAPIYYDRGQPPPRQGGFSSSGRRSVSPERNNDRGGIGGRDEFGRSRPPADDDRRASRREVERRRGDDDRVSRGERYDRRQPSPPSYHHRHPSRDDRGWREDNFRYNRYRHDAEEPRGGGGGGNRSPQRRPRSRSRSPRRSHRRSRSYSSSESSTGSSSHGSPRRRR